MILFAVAACDGVIEPVHDPLEAGRPGIRLVRIEANQGVGIPIVSGDAWVPPEVRNAPLVENRQTLIWARWQVDPGWESRWVRARLHVTLPDGTRTSLVQARFVDTAPSTFESPSRNFAWELSPDQAQSGTRIQISVDVRTEAGGPGGWAEAGAFPPSPEPVGFEAGLQEIRVTLVPVRHDWPGSCPDTPELAEADVETLGELLHRRNPTQRVRMRLREPFVWDESLSTYSGLLGALSQLRFQDEADPEEYYAGLVHHCVRVGGQAIAVPDFPTRDNAWTRTVVSAWRGSAPLTSTTFVHEMGHAQGRRHVRCTGAEGSPDPDYPYPAGNIGVWGYNIVVPDARMPWLSGNTYHPVEANDYMGYCTGPQHVSDYGWRRVHRFVREISGWEAGDPAGVAPAAEGARPDPGRLLVGAVHPDGSEDWFEVPGRLGPQAPRPGIYVEISVDGMLFRLPAWEGRRPHGDVRILAVELPASLDGVEAAARVEESGRRPLLPEAIRVFRGPS